MNIDLENASIVITRPIHQAQSLYQALEEIGADPILFPTIEIIPNDIDQVTLSHLEQLEKYHMAIFTSSNAVIHAINLLKRLGKHFGEHTCIIAIGNGTKKSLQQYNIKVDLMPKEFNSESLLKLAIFRHCRHHQVIIFSGTGGREFLYNTLRQRCDKVFKANVYQRILPKVDIKNLFNVSKIHFIITTSNTGLYNLFEILPKIHQTMIKDIPTVVVSDRGIKLAKALGIKVIIKAKNASDEEIIKALKKYTQGNP